MSPPDDTCMTGSGIPTPIAVSNGSDRVESTTKEIDIYT